MSKIKLKDCKLNLPNDPFILELLPEFVETWIQDLENFYNFKANGQKDELYRMAHTLKGSCYQFSINDIGDMGVQLMGYAKVEDWENSSLLFEKIKNRFIEVNEYLKSIGLAV